MKIYYTSNKLQTFKQGQSALLLHIEAMNFPCVITCSWGSLSLAEKLLMVRIPFNGHYFYDMVVRTYKELQH